MKKILIIIFSFSCIQALAQENFINFQYSIGFGTGDLGDFIDSPSFRGFVFDYRRKVEDNIALGVEVGWNVFYDELNFDTYTVENLSITGKQWRYNNQVPLLFAADYFLATEEKVKPFAGLGIGTMYSRRNTNMNVYTIEEEAWNFALRPEVGVIYDISYSTGVSATAKYYIGFESGDLPTQSYLSLNLGILFLLY